MRTMGTFSLSIRVGFQGNHEEEEEGSRLLGEPGVEAKRAEAPEDGDAVTLIEDTEGSHAGGKQSSRLRANVRLGAKPQDEESLDEALTEYEKFYRDAKRENKQLSQDWMRWVGGGGGGGWRCR